MVLAPPTQPEMGVLLQEASTAAAQLALMMFCDEVRKLSMKFSGYECAVSP